VQVFRNILDNAVKYSLPSGPPKITITYNKVDGWHQFSITDSGPGIGQEYKDKIFVPFFRTPEAISSPGTGMGLAIVSDIISSWGGKIWLDTTTSSGTTISFQLPPHTGG
jgi:signal transduction histidine kinase